MLHWFKNAVDTVKLWIKSFLCEYMFKYNLFLWSKQYFQHYYSSLQCLMIFRNHNNILIYCSQTFLIIINVENSWNSFFCIKDGLSNVLFFFYSVRMHLCDQKWQDIYNVSKDFQNAVLLRFHFNKVSIHCSFLNNIKQKFSKFIIIRTINDNWANQHIGMISERSCDWSNDAKYSALKRYIAF